jgi:histone acetyltransferase (RNA polymerase elongator complex component)
MQSGRRVRPKPFVVPVFIPHAGCPHRCVFCDQTRTTGRCAKFPGPQQLQADIDRFLGYRRDARRPSEIAFFGGNFLGLTPERAALLLDLGTDYVRRGIVQGVRFSTRPDTITAESLAFIARYPVTTIEIGVQSMNEGVLEISRRGHTAQDTRKAVALLRKRPWRLGLQMMTGLPGDTPSQCLDTGMQIAALAPDFVRIYPTLVLKGSPLAKWWTQGRYAPMELDPCIDLVKSLLALFLGRRIPVARMGLQPTADLNPDAGVEAGPFHPAFGELVHAALWRDALHRWLESHRPTGKALEIQVHPSNLSRVRGQRNATVEWIRHEFKPARTAVRPLADLPLDAALINGRLCPLLPAVSEPVDPLTANSNFSRSASLLVDTDSDTDPDMPDDKLRSIP